MTSSPFGARPCSSTTPTTPSPPRRRAGMHRRIPMARRTSRTSPTTRTTGIRASTTARTSPRGASTPRRAGTRRSDVPPPSPFGPPGRSPFLDPEPEPIHVLPGPTGAAGQLGAQPLELLAAPEPFLPGSPPFLLAPAVLARASLHQHHHLAP